MESSKMTTNPMPNRRPRPMRTIRHALANRLSDITHIVGESNYSRVFFTSDRCEVFSKSLSWFEKEFADVGLLRIHKTTLVQPKAVQSWEQFDAQQMRVSMPRDSFWVARRRVDQVRQQLEALTL
jgi:DNA-binding LytR/AlgR family response regulator